jgi:diamine N-acetyltransferase
LDKHNSQKEIKYLLSSEKNRTRLLEAIKNIEAGNVQEQDLKTNMKHHLTYGKISLRPLEPEDIDLLYQWENNMEIWEVSNTRTPFSKYVLAGYLKESARDIYETKQLRLIIENEKSEAVGAIDLFDFDPYHMRAGIGILIHKPENRNHGYATDALNAMFGYVVEILGLKQLYANIAAKNEASIHLFEKEGFVESGIKKNWLKTSDGWEDEIFLQKFLIFS